MSFREYLSIARERWLMVVLGLLLGTGLGAAHAVMATAQYASSSTFYVSAPDVGQDLGQAYQGNLLIGQKIKSYVDMAADRRLREQVSARLGAPIAPGTISASAKPGTVLLTLTAKDSSAARAQRIAELTAQEFTLLVAEVERGPNGASLVSAREIQPAQLPTEPFSPRQKTEVALGLLLGLIIGFSAAVARHLMDRTVKSPDTLADLAQAPVIGATQYDPNIKARPLIVHDQPRAPMAEAFRQLRTNLGYVDLDHNRKLLVVTSALPHEGKTTTTLNLAIALAQAGNRVAVVEADLRRPRAAQVLGLENAVGLTTVLTGEVDLDVALQPWGGISLDFLGAGALPPNPSELLASAQMAAVLAELESRYDIVLLDAAPTLPVADAAVLAAMCHGVLFVARHSWVRSEQVQAAVESIRRVGAPVVGVVLSMAPPKRGGGSSYQYGYGYSYAAAGSPVAGASIVTTPQANLEPMPAIASRPVEASPVPAIADSPSYADQLEYFDAWLNDRAATLPGPRVGEDAAEPVGADGADGAAGSIR